MYSSHALPRDLNPFPGSLTLVHTARRPYRVPPRARCHPRSRRHGPTPPRPARMLSPTPPSILGQNASTRRLGRPAAGVISRSVGRRGVRPRRRGNVAAAGPNGRVRGVLLGERVRAGVGLGDGSGGRGGISGRRGRARYAAVPFPVHHTRRRSFSLKVIGRVETGDLDVKVVLRHFQSFVQTLGAQTVTVTCSSLLHDMLEAYDDFTRTTGTRFRRHEDIEQVAREFLFTRECFFFGANRLPVVQAAFFTTAADLRSDELSLQIQFAWNPPVLGFANLCNVAHEGDTFMLLPSTVSSPPLSWLQPHTTEYFIGSAEDWLQWDQEDEAFTGTVPPHLASNAGAERLDRFTTSIELTAIMTKDFGGGIKFERIFRVAVPLTVHRRPDVCSSLRETMTSPPPRLLGRASGSKASLSRKHGSQTPSSLDSRLSSPIFFTQPTPAINPLQSLPQARSAPAKVLRRVRPGRDDLATPTGDKENEDITLKELSHLLKRKTQHSQSPSPAKSHALSLARFHDAGGFHLRRPCSTEFEVMTMLHGDEKVMGRAATPMIPASLRGTGNDAVSTIRRRHDSMQTPRGRSRITHQALPWSSEQGLVGTEGRARPFPMSPRSKVTRRKVSSSFQFPDISSSRNQARRSSTPTSVRPDNANLPRRSRAAHVTSQPWVNGAEGVDVARWQAEIRLGWKTAHWGTDEVERGWHGASVKRRRGVRDGKITDSDGYESEL
nr:hypothetical protein CFP56_29945 [Quercus suber]